MPRNSKPKQPRSGREATRPILQRPPDPEDAATPEQEAYISGDRLDQELIELNPQRKGRRPEPMPDALDAG